jgi:hypothetical protein
MSGPNDTDDGWGELARELGLEQPAPPPRPTIRREPEPEPEPVDDGFAPPTDDEFSALPADSTDEDEGEDEEGGDEEAEGAAVEGEPGEPKKKRRRRRRKKKRSSDGEPAPAPALRSDAPAEADGDTDEEGIPAYSSDDGYRSPGEPIEEEMPTPEAARELIANWDVPSWEMIVTTMLYRPGGR